MPINTPSKNATASSVSEMPCSSHDVLRNNIDFDSFIDIHIQKKSTSYELMDFLFISPQLAIIQVVIEAFICKEGFMVPLFDDLTIFKDQNFVLLLE